MSTVIRIILFVQILDKSFDRATISPVAMENAWQSRLQNRSVQRLRTNMVDNPKVLQRVESIPAGYCYRKAFLMASGSALNCTDRLHLCHAIVVQTRYPFQPMGHAFCSVVSEDGKTVFVYDGRFPRTPILRERYYAVGQIREDSVKRYTWFEAKHLFRETGLYGPWDEVIAAAAHT